MNSEDMTAMAELPFIKADIREIFEIPLKNVFKPQRKRRRIWVKPQLGRKKFWCRRMKMVKGELCRNRHQKTAPKQAQMAGSSETSQQVCSPVQLGQGGGSLPEAQTQPLAHSWQPCGDSVHMQAQRQMGQGGGMAPNVGPQPVDHGGEATEVTVKVCPQKLSHRWEAPGVTVEVQPQKLSHGWEAPEVTVQVQLQQQGSGPAISQVTVQVRPQGQRAAGLKVSVQLQLGHDQEEVNYVQDQREEMLGNGEQQTLKQNQGESMARSEGERESAVVELVSQGVRSQEQDQVGAVIKPQHNECQEEETAEVVQLQETRIQKADLDGMVTEEQLQDQSLEQELKADLPPQKESQRAAETRQQQGDVQVQEGPKGLQEQQEDLGQEVFKKRPRDIPNYFVSIPVTDDQILDRIEDVQELIFTKEPDLLRALVPVQTMHLTIIVAHLGTEEEVKKAVLALKQSKTKVEAILQGKDLNMTFHGIGQFNNQVIYVKMSEEDQKTLSKIAEAVEECFNEMDLDISGSKDFKPHLTFLKLSKAPRLKRRGFRKICSDLYKEYEDCYFGTEVFSQIDLCAMRKKKQESGYYHCECSVYVGSGGTKESQEQEMQMEDIGETASEDSPNNAAEAEKGAITESCNLASCLVVADYKPFENIAEASVASKEKEINEVNGEPEAKDETSLAAGGICSKPEPGLLPVRPDALKSVDEGKEKAKITDGNLQKTEAREYASDQPDITG